MKICEQFSKTELSETKLVPVLIWSGIGCKSKVLGKVNKTKNNSQKSNQIKKKKANNLPTKNRKQENSTQMKQLNGSIFACPGVFLQVK